MSEDLHDVYRGATDDVYRGAPLLRTVTAPSTSSMFSSETSSSGSSLFGVRRLGAIGVLVENAITRWAKGQRSASSSSSSSTASSDSYRSRTTNRSTYRNRRSSVAHLSEVDFTERISIMKARQESRQVPRQFGLYLPPSLSPLTRPRPGPTNDGTSVLPTGQGIIHTHSLQEVLSELDTALKRSTKLQKNLERKKVSAADPQTQLPDFVKVPSRPPSFTDLKSSTRPKGKQKDVGVYANTSKAWYLDVASPSSADMHAIGKLLHLHPLTLEDIIQQDPREKLEHFQKLGYYFLSFRTVDGQRAKQRPTQQLYKHGISDNESNIGEANVYLVVFSEGIAFFHFNDISEHIERVRHRIVQFGDVAKVSADWIAHLILDSIVDDLAVMLDEIGQEVMDFEDLVFSGEASELSNEPPKPKPQPPAPEPVYSEKQASLLKEDQLSDQGLKPHFVLPEPRPRQTFPPHHISHAVWSRWRRRRSESSSPSAPEPTTNKSLLRMARTRRLVTSLGRLLATKSEVMTQVRKRLLSPTGIGGGQTHAENVEVAMYMGQVQDHILALQHSLSHYERMLNQSHPIYLSQLRTRATITKQSSDKAIIWLTVVSVAVLCLQSLIGIFSVNIMIPRNTTGYNVFGSIIAGASIILVGVLSLVRRWWEQAKRRRAAIL